MWKLLIVLYILTLVGKVEPTEVDAKGVNLALHPSFDPSLVDDEDAEGRLQLVSAVLDGDIDTMQVLLSYYASSNLVESASGRSALVTAFSEAKMEAAWLMLRYGGDPDAADAMGESARSIAPSHPLLLKLIELSDADGAMAFEDAPGAWARVVTEGGDRPYYYNHHTKAATYHPPPSCAWYRTEINGHPVYMNEITHQSTFARPPALSWRRTVSITEKAFFWVNFVTNQTSIAEPAEMPQDLIDEEIRRTGQYWYNKITGQTTWQDPKEVEWIASWADNGKRYWFNPVTKETTWAKPVVLAWIEVPYEEDPRKVYWWNEITQDSRVRVPEEIAWVLTQHKAKISFNGSDG